MKRRDFIRGAALVTAASAVPVMGMANNKQTNEAAKKKGFKLKYAPHFGMFKNSAGNDLMDQLQFVSDKGFTALEDNGMKKKDIPTQEKIASKMANLGLEMGVFVAHTIAWKEPGLAKGDKDQLKKIPW